MAVVTRDVCGNMLPRKPIVIVWGMGTEYATCLNCGTLGVITTLKLTLLRDKYLVKLCILELLIQNKFLGA